MTKNSNEGTIEKKKEEEEDLMSKLLSHYLIWSVVVSIVVIAFGTTEYIFTGSTGYIKLPALILIKTSGITPGVFPHFVPSIIGGVIQFKSFAIIQLGVLILLLTPLGRIFLQIFIFVKEKDRAFISIAATVFFILVLSLYISKFFL